MTFKFPFTFSKVIQMQHAVTPLYIYIARMSLDPADKKTPLFRNLVKKKKKIH